MRIPMNELKSDLDGKQGWSGPWTSTRLPLGVPSLYEPIPQLDH